MSGGPTEPTAPRARRGAVLHAAIAVAMVAAIVSGQSPSLVIGIGFVVSLVSVVALRARGTRLSAATGGDGVRLGLEWATLHVMLSDGEPGAEEVKRAAEAHRDLLAIDLPEDAVRAQARLARRSGDDLRGMLELLAPELAEDEKKKVLEGAVRVAVADGDLDGAERPAVGAVAEALGLGPGDVRAVVAELSARPT